MDSYNREQAIHIAQVMLKLIRQNAVLKGSIAKIKVEIQRLRQKKQELVDKFFLPIVGVCYLSNVEFSGVPSTDARWQHDIVLTAEALKAMEQVSDALQQEYQLCQREVGDLCREIQRLKELLHLPLAPRCE